MKLLPSKFSAFSLHHIAPPYSARLLRNKFRFMSATRYPMGAKYNPAPNKPILFVKKLSSMFTFWQLVREIAPPNEAEFPVLSIVVLVIVTKSAFYACIAVQLKFEKLLP